MNCVVTKPYRSGALLDKLEASQFSLCFYSPQRHRTSIDNDLMNRLIQLNYISREISICRISSSCILPFNHHYTETCTCTCPSVSVSYNSLRPGHNLIFFSPLYGLVPPPLTPLCLYAMPIFVGEGRRVYMHTHT